jgi:hypothetical protein
MAGSFFVSPALCWSWEFSPYFSSGGEDMTDIILIIVVFWLLFWMIRGR